MAMNTLISGADQSGAAVDGASTFEKGGGRSLCIQRHSKPRALDVSNSA
jgi:hypothetical protein